MVYKTLVVLTHDAGPGTTGQRRPLLVMIAADRVVDLKKVASAVGVKRVEMAPAREAERLTGLKIGGISALALLEKRFRVYLDELARGLDEIVISAGVRGLNLRLRVADLLRVTGTDWIDASRPAAGDGEANEAAVH
jgi:Cys-tRNA(Pro)/Cys-tRNA(Cys) deacylase